jgi:Zn-dependent alcohol dehydrogenase
MASPISAVPATMKAAILAAGSPSLTIEQIAVPRPQRGEALIQVAACGVCHTDLHVIKGEVAFPRPAVLGHEISGTVVQFGPDTADTRGLSIGDSVAGAFIMPCTQCPACLRGRDDLCAEFFGQNRLKGTLYDGTSRVSMPDGSFLAMYSMGGLAEYCVVPISALSALADSVDVETSCILGCAGLTSYGAVFRAGQVERGSSVAIVGVGGIGSSIIQMARAAGAETIVAVDIATDKLDRARELGATHAVNSLETDPVVAVREFTNGGAEVVFEALGHPSTFRQASKMLADGGRMVAIGIAAGSPRLHDHGVVRRTDARGSAGGDEARRLRRLRRQHPDHAALLARRCRPGLPGACPRGDHGPRHHHHALNSRRADPEEDRPRQPTQPRSRVQPPT